MAMTKTVKDMMRSARITLNDSANVRWTLPELLIYINDGIREIAFAKPNAVSKTVEINLDQGTYQTHDFLALIRVTRNLTAGEAAPGGRAGGTGITAIERHVLDASMPGWQDPTVYPYAAQVDHIAQDMADPQAFYVVPGNDGSGLIEAIVAKLPAEIPEPATGQTDINSYGDVIQLQDVWGPTLLNYVLYRAFSKDAVEPGNAQRSASYYSMFASALGLKTQVETVANVDTTGST